MPARLRAPQLVARQESRAKIFCNTTKLITLLPEIWRNQRDITPRDAVSKAEKALSNWKGGPVERLTLPINPANLREEGIYIPRPNSVQTYLVLANRAVDRTNPDYIACLVMNQVLGSGPAARLFRIIREEKGYTYGISSSFTATHYQEHFMLLLPSERR